MTRTNGDPGRGDESGGTGGPTDSAGLPGRRRLEKIADSASSKAGSAYQGAMESVFAIVVGTGIGYWVDTKYGTEPRWLIVGAIVGFAAFVLRLARMAKLVGESEQASAGDEASSGESKQKSKSGDDDRSP